MVFVWPKIITRPSEISLSNSYHGGWNVFNYAFLFLYQLTFFRYVIIV